MVKNDDNGNHKEMKEGPHSHDIPKAYICSWVRISRTTGKSQSLTSEHNQGQTEKANDTKDKSRITTKN